MKKRMFAIGLVFAVVSILLAGCRMGSAGRTAEAAPQTQAVAEVQNFGRTEAYNAVKNTIVLDYDKYKIDLIRDALQVDGQDYYEFQISDGRTALKPSILVSKVNGAVYCYSNHALTDVYEDAVFGSKC